MKITLINEEDKITFKLDGWLDTVSSPELGAEVEKVEKASEIVLDFEKVEYIASSGLRQVVATHRKAKELGADFSVINVGTEAMAIFKLTGIDKKIKITAL
ncbi:MAG: STAS domain-containing protein [Clostridiales bacterium]|nr:STAS domain-containing protein [Candidatus Coliplasma equi]